MASLTAVTLRSEPVPQWMMERHIYSGYRDPYGSLGYTLKSVLTVHNETVNVWTHLVPGLVFAWILWETVNHVLLMPHEHVSRHDAVVAIVYLFGSTMYHFQSAIAHTFANYTVYARELAYRFDYVSISLYGFSCGLAVYQMSTFCLPGWATPYVDWVIAAGAFLCCWLACVSRQWGNWQYAFRTVLFFSYWLLCNVGLLHRLAFQSPPVSSYWNWHMITFLGGAIMNATKFPESVWPGRFDVVGHSHQWFHMLSSVGTYLQLLALERDQASMTHLRTAPHYRSITAVIAMPVALCACLFAIALVDQRSYMASQDAKKTL